MTLAEMIATLDDGDDRGIMRLKYLGGHTVKQFAISLGISEGNVTGHLRRGREELRKKYPDDFHLD